MRLVEEYAADVKIAGRPAPVVGVYPADVSDIRTDVRGWLDEHWDPEMPLAEWRGLLADSGWGCPTWPEQWFGRGLEASAARAVDEVFTRVGAVGPALGVGMSLAAPTILRYGSDDIKRRFLRGIITGEDKWTQLFSEPGNGSDLAGLTTHAVRSGDEWIVNGQKVWNTGAHHADYGLLVARTDWEVPKHAGLTYFVLPMKQPGIEVRPLKQANGYSSFNEVFMTDARVPDVNVVGAVGDGWAVALTTLAHERGLATLRLPTFAADAPHGRTAREATEEAAEYFKTYVWYPQRAGRPDLVISQAKALGVNRDPRIRQKIADLVAFQRAAQWTVQRAQANRKAGQPGPEGSIAKLCGSEIARRSARLHAEIAGASALLAGADGPANGVVSEVLISVPAQSIAGGTDEIQRNIIGERVLALPKEPQVDRDVPFREVRTNRG
jgi:alkylation response protein AidB-like acyl-CoA dehydrogenase